MQIECHTNRVRILYADLIPFLAGIFPYILTILFGLCYYMTLIMQMTLKSYLKAIYRRPRCNSDLKYQLITSIYGGPGGSMGQVVGLPNDSYKHITNTSWVRARLFILQKGCTRLTTTGDKVNQLLAHGRWFSPCTPASSTTKTDRRDIVDILLKVALSTIN